MNLLRDVPGWAVDFEQRHGRKPTESEIAFFDNFYQVSLEYKEQGYRDAVEGIEPLTTENFRNAAEREAEGRSAKDMERALWFATHLYECYMIGYNGFQQHAT